MRMRVRVRMRSLVLMDDCSPDLGGDWVARVPLAKNSYNSITVHQWCSSGASVVRRWCVCGAMVVGQYLNDFVI